MLVAAAWPILQGWRRVALLGAALGLMASPWWALVLTMRGQGMPLFTLQSAQLPWETCLVLPGSWLLLLAMMSRAKSGNGRPQI